jgi:hypothetical protein
VADDLDAVLAVTAPTLPATTPEEATAPAGDTLFVVSAAFVATLPRRQAFTPVVLTANLAQERRATSDAADVRRLAHALLIDAGLAGSATGLAAERLILATDTLAVDTELAAAATGVAAGLARVAALTRMADFVREATEFRPTLFSSAAKVRWTAECPFVPLGRRFVVDEDVLDRATPAIGMASPDAAPPIVAVILAALLILTAGDVDP